ncbi:hypothetical protein [Bartonella bacilliformis]|uniref:hypothetical protein n=1 Tax=Bartonella bacilliformis TaxID=774 RepID=UPI001FD88DF2|nr:hypothetical protein [Bartonella bacilliformis]
MEKITTGLIKSPPLCFAKNHLEPAQEITLSRKRTKRGCRLPENYEPDREAAVTLGLPPERVALEIAKFRDYWLAKAGAHATKVDWYRTWRNWVRTAIEQLDKRKHYGNSNNSQSGGQRGWSHSVARYMSTIKDSSDLYSILRDEDDKTAVSLGSRQEAFPFRGEENYLFGT